ncbi:MAG: DUF5765 domain-containing protein [Pseudoruegeria sp.]
MLITEYFLMCWSPGISACFAIAGTGITVYSAFKGKPRAFTAISGFFTIMEVLQAFSYNYIDQCGSFGNETLTKLAFLHISLHPFFFNALALQFVPEAVRLRVSPWVYMACGISAIAMFFQLEPISGGGYCNPSRGTCGSNFCTFSGNWHLAWHFPFNSWGNSFAQSSNFVLSLFPNAFVTYTLTVFIVPLMYGAIKLTALQFLFGPVLASLLTNNQHEQPAIWCLLSIWIFAIVTLTPVQNWLKVGDWKLPWTLKNRFRST